MGATESAVTTYYDGPSIDTYVFIGRYTAGRIAPPTGSTGRDIALNQIGVPGGGIATATVDLTCQNSVAAAILGGESVDPGQFVTIFGEYYQSDLLPPVTYQWYAGSTLLPGETGTSLQVQGGAPNTVAHFQFHVTDSENRTVSASRNVVTTAGCGAQLECE